MYAILKGVPLISNQKTIEILGDRLALTVDSVDTEEFDGARIVAIFDEAFENSIDDGGTVDYDAMETGVCGIARFRTPEYNPNKPNRTVLQALDNLKDYLDSINYTDWEIVEIK